jgi:hypothetical protein
MKGKITNSVFLDQLKVLQLVKKLPEFYRI